MIIPPQPSLRPVQSLQIMQIRDGFAQDADLVAVALVVYHRLVLGIG